MKVGLCLLFLVTAGVAQAQDPGAQQADVGPTILSRTDMQVPVELPRPANGNSFDFFLFADGIYNINVPVYNQSTPGTYGDSPGFDVGGGLDLYHRFQRGSISLTYAGSWREYSNSNLYSGVQQGLNFNFKYLLSRRLTLSLLQNIATAPNGIGAYQFAQNPYAGSNGEAGESRLFLTGGGLNYQQTTRFSYQFSGDFFVSQYHPYNAYNSLGGQGTGSINYRISRQATIAFSYSYLHFNYSNVGNVSSNQMGYATYAYAITPRTQFSVSGGVTSASLKEEILVGTPPLLGVFHSTTVFPYFNGNLTHTARRGSASIQASQSVLAGNGILGTSKAISVSGSAAYSPSPKWALSGTAGYQHLTALGLQMQTGNSYGNGFVGLGFSYKLSRHFGLRSNFNYGLYDNYGNVGRNATGMVSFGITFTSGDRPVISF
jgi:hypothetical protein